jgi:ubiquinone/menaquinone biosynthesis C-methylase UbiE
MLDIGCATGEYLLRLNECGLECVGVEANPQYVEAAKNKGLDVYNMDARHLEFPDKSFDTALLFEVLEHIDDPARVLREAKRVSKKNVLITVPNCTEFGKLSPMGLTFEHMLEKDHINFFTKEDLEGLLSSHFNRFLVEESEPIYLSVQELPKFLNSAMYRLYRWKLVKPLAYYRLYAVAEID